MREDIAKKWTEALRSGKYEQGTRHLNRDGKFCCLGVLCEMLEIPKTLEQENNSTFKYYESTTFVPSEVLYLADMYSPEGIILNTMYIGERIYTSLADANDSGATFIEIADFIDENFATL